MKTARVDGQDATLGRRRAPAVVSSHVGTSWIGGLFLTYVFWTDSSTNTGKRPRLRVHRREKQEVAELRFSGAESLEV